MFLKIPCQSLQVPSIEGQVRILHFSLHIIFDISLQPLFTLPTQGGTIVPLLHQDMSHLTVHVTHVKHHAR